MKRYEDIGNFWNERRAGNTEADVEQREAQQTLKAARRQERAGSVGKEERQGSTIITKKPRKQEQSRDEANRSDPVGRGRPCGQLRAVGF